MPDQIDFVQALVDERHANALAAHQASIESGPAFEGYCLECGEDLPSPRRWCNAQCRDQLERSQR